MKKVRRWVKYESRSLWYVWVARFWTLLGCHDRAAMSAMRSLDITGQMMVEAFREMNIATVRAAEEFGRMTGREP